jgi:hypothetical protein
MKTKELIFHGTNISEEIKKYISVLIPSTSFFETNASFSNCIGISQNSNKVLTKLNNFYSVSDLISFTCNLSNIPQVSFAGLYTQISYNNRFEKVYPYAIIDYFLHIGKYDHIHIVNTFFTVNNFVSNNVNYYKTDNVTLNSDTLQKCSLLLLNNNNNFII